MAEAAAEEVEEKGSSKKLIIIVAAVVLLVGIAVGATLMMMGGGEEALADGEVVEEEAPPEPIYVPLNPAFVVNFHDKRQRTKFLKAELSVASTEDDAQELIEKHMPAIRNVLVLLLSRQIYDDLMTHEGKEKLRADALSEVQGVLEQQAGTPIVSDLFFSSLVMQ